ncbi:beta-lactamase domain-containing protein [Pseudothermotoga thermarum DSM 5069]|uniref:Metallo-beta-lactamase domain-containing protein 1 n=1 Tax=Pseudothermotoga thermarum DSM 5069 TaxID=688269 RepID=F7YV72_9THEM|nr:MBL fold metallo-hydrolase [Pseudothermotoga thermarum]AEH50371.1 beta-lactamase domain-containing protein [Pseudothermotoga thermarum DSM 5069]
MKFEVLIPGGTIRVSPYVFAPYSTVCLLYDEKRLILIDPGGFPAYEALEKVLMEKNIKPEDVSDILITHVHMDHIFNTVFFKNATVYVHEKALERKYADFGPLSGKLYSNVVYSWKQVQTLKGGETLFNCVNVYFTPYHSSDHLSFLIETENMGKVFVTGDICLTRIDYYEMIKGYRNDDAAKFIREMSKNCDWIVFPHGEPLKVGQKERG